MSMVKEFKEFVMRGNVIDLAVGIVIGAAFGKIVSSLVGDVIMPPIGLVLGGVNFTNLKLPLGTPLTGGEVVTLNYGAFIQTMVDFLIVAFAIFLVVKGVNSMKRKQEAAPAAPPMPAKEELLLTEIRDLLKARQ
jgi:large conductance mechanosensitive channel